MILRMPVSFFSLERRAPCASLLTCGMVPAKSVPLDSSSPSSRFAGLVLFKYVGSSSWKWAGQLALLLGQDKLDMSDVFELELEVDGIV
jgi:hypothetical protein